MAIYDYASEFDTAPPTEADSGNEILDLTGEVDPDDAELVGLTAHELPTRRSLEIVALLAAHEASLARRLARQGAEPPSERETVDQDFLEQLPTRVHPDLRQLLASAHRSPPR